jgi:hypothetical protein
MRLLSYLSLIIKLLKGGENTMVDVYVALIIHHIRTFAQVPAQLQPSVHAALLALGLDDNGNPIAEQ